MIRWQQVNDDGLEYAIQQGPYGDEFVKLLNGCWLSRPAKRATEKDKFHDDLRLAIESALGILNAQDASLPCEVLWKFLARDLLKRIDEAFPQRDAPSLESSSPRSGSERDAATSLNWWV